MAALLKCSFLVALMTLAVGCGQKGPLYLPQPEAEPVQPVPDPATDDKRQR